MVLRAIATALALICADPGAALECGGKESPCKVEGGEYHIVLPEGWTGGPAIMHLHGYGGSGAKVIGNAGFVAPFLARGYALIAPSALPRIEGNLPDWSARTGWLFYPRDDVVFLRKVLEDAVARHDVARDLLILSGFSRGGSMVWDAACRTPDFAAAYAPVAGGFWLPMATGCAGAVNLLHTHGFTDQVVPLEGRPLHSEKLKITITQADIWQGLQYWRQVNGCQSKATRQEVADGLWRKGWTCDSGDLQLVLHPGGHRLPPGWADILLDWFERLDR